MNTQPGRLLTEQEIRAFRAAWPRRDGADLCQCGHAEGDHVINEELGGYTVGECAVHRGDGGPECGCERFVPTGGKDGA